jgi:hypothetical protein
MQQQQPHTRTQSSFHLRASKLFHKVFSGRAPQQDPCVAVAMPNLI